MAVNGFLSRTIEKAIYNALVATPELVAVVGENIQRGRRVASLPACNFFMESSAYDAANMAVAAEHISSGTYRYVVLVHCAGESDAPIAGAANAQFAALAGQSIDTSDDYEITFTAAGEVPVKETWDGATPYQQLGTIYLVTITKG